MYLKCRHLHYISWIYSGVCYDERSYNEQFLSFFSGCYDEHRAVLFLMESSIIVFTRERLFMLFMCVRLFMLFIRESLYIVFTRERLFMLFMCVRLFMLFIRESLLVVFTKEILLMPFKFTCTVSKVKQINFTLILQLYF
jgi:hypothetical protein